MPSFAVTKLEPAGSCPPHPKESFVHEQLMLTRFINDSDPPQPVLIVESNDTFAPLGLVTLLQVNDAAREVWSQAGLDDGYLIPDQFQLKIRFEIEKEVNLPNNHGAPTVIRPSHFPRPLKLAKAGD
jgi:hypothetical protein